MSCLFDSIAALLKIEGGGSALRQDCVDHLVSNFEVNGVPIDQWLKWESNDDTATLAAYAARMRRQDAWGGALELAAMAQLLRVQIAVHLVQPAGGGCAAEFGGGTRRVNLLYNGSHYTPSHVSEL